MKSATILCREPVENTVEISPRGPSLDWHIFVVTLISKLLKRCSESQAQDTSLIQYSRVLRHVREIVHMCGDLEGAWGRSPKFEVGDGPCIRPHNISRSTVQYFSSKFELTKKWRFFTKKGHSEILSEKFIFRPPNSVPRFRPWLYINTKWRYKPDLPGDHQRLLQSYSS